MDVHKITAYRRREELRQKWEEEWSIVAKQLMDLSMGGKATEPLMKVYKRRLDELSEKLGYPANEPLDTTTHPSLSTRPDSKEFSSLERSGTKASSPSYSRTSSGTSEEWKTHSPKITLTGRRVFPVYGASTIESNKAFLWTLAIGGGLIIGIIILLDLMPS